MKLKVLHIITRLDPGGSAYNTLETVARLEKARYETTLISGRTVDPDGSTARFINRQGISCVFISNLQRAINPVHDLIAFIRLYYYIRRLHPDIVHTHTSKAGVLGRWAAWLAGVKYIVHTPHGHVFYGYFNPVITQFFVIIERLTARITDRIILLTDLGKNDHIRFGIAAAAKFVTIYSGICVERFRDAPDTSQHLRRVLDIPDDHFIFGSVTRLVPIKGNTHLITALAIVVARYPKVTLLLVGDGEEKANLQQQCRQLGVETHVVFAGFQKNVTDFIRTMDVFVLASLNEGMGRVIIEAMAAGKPVISTRTGGIPELVEDGKEGILVMPGDAKGLAHAMCHLRERSDKRRMFVENAREKVTEKFSIERMVTNIDALYQQMVGGKL